MKKILFILTINFMVTCIYAQSNWTFSSGIGYMFAPSKLLYINEISSNNDTAVIQYKILAQGFSFFMYPKYHFVEPQPKSRGRKSSSRVADEKPFDFSVGIPFMLGFSGISGGGTNSGISFMYTAALAADINFGGCTANSESAMGAYVGLGIGAANTSQSTIVSQTQVDNSFYNSKYKTVSSLVGYYPTALGIGPVIHGGFEYGNNSQNKFGLHIGYQPALNKNGLNYYIIGLQIPFGRGMNMMF